MRKWDRYGHEKMDREWLKKGKKSANHKRKSLCSLLCVEFKSARWKSWILTKMCETTEIETTTLEEEKKHTETQTCIENEKK